MARQLDSRVLAGQLYRMIKDLITKLMEKANKEAEHQGWCDAELSTDEQTRKEETERVAEIDQLEASIAKMTEDISDLTKATAELDGAMGKETTIQQEEKATNEQTVADAGEAQTAAAQALTVLREFYAKAALLQELASPYKGMQAENGGVVGMLEVIESDFARWEADTKAAEATAKKEYDTFLTDSSVDKAAKTRAKSRP